ncbi:MAG: class I SAM-dependent methyltransferase [Alphaproteobacteria bacterium]|nr:class I SAM-dependent methyltransferase [Alphaproteobacteria bacterium]
MFKTIKSAIKNFLTQRPNKLNYRGMYANWAYPEPVIDLEVFLSEGNFIYCDPSKDHDLFFPEKPPAPNQSILIAGCGTMEAPLVAHNNPNASVIGIDQSATSLAHAERLKQKHNLANLELIHMDLRNAASLDRKFDIVISSGVLHHLPIPEEGLKALSAVLKDDGSMLLSLYAKYPRTGVYMMQEAFRRLNVGYDKEEIIFARDVISSLPSKHPLRFYVSNDDLSEAHDTDVVDMFLNTKDRAYSVPEILAFSDACDLSFQSWFDNLYYYPDGMCLGKEDLYQKISRLPEQEQWAVVELLAPMRGNHRFLLRKRSYNGNGLRINFDGANSIKMVPSRRNRLQVEHEEDGSLRLSREWHNCVIGGYEAELFLGIDGKKTIEEIINIYQIKPTPGEKTALPFFEKMWKLGHITLSTANSP